MAKRCFVIAPIGDDESFVRKRSDQIFRHVIEPAVKECDYNDITRADQMDTPGIITNQIIDRLVNDELVIADLTWSNPNVIYELAVRHSFRKPVVQIKDSLDHLPFDIQGMRTINVDYRFVDSMNECKGKIINQIKSIESDPNNIQSPVSYALDILSVVGKNVPGSKIIMQLDSQVQTLLTKMADLENRIPKLLIRESGSMVSGYQSPSIVSTAGSDFLQSEFLQSLRRPPGVWEISNNNFPTTKPEKKNKDD